MKNEKQGLFLTVFPKRRINVVPEYLPAHGGETFSTWKAFDGEALSSDNSCLSYMGALGRGPCRDLIG